jgi:hypothetical protein
VLPRCRVPRYSLASSGSDTHLPDFSTTQAACCASWRIGAVAAIMFLAFASLAIYVGQGDLHALRRMLLKNLTEAMHPLYLRTTSVPLLEALS